MTTKNFVVKNGLTTGNIILDASSSNITANVVVANLSVPASANLGSNANVKITGGASGQVLQTDGAGNLTWSTPAGTYANSNVASYLPTYTGNITANNINATSNVTAQYFIGNGSQLTGLPATYANSNVAAYLPTYTGNITGNIITLTGNVTAINANLGNLVTANFFTGSGNLLSNIQAGNITGTVANANYAAYAGNVINAAQSNITSLGTLSGLTINGNLTVSGSTTYVNVTTTAISDPIIEVGGGANGTALTTDDNKDRGTLLHYYSGSSTVDAFMGWDDSNAEFAFGSNVSVASEVVTFNSFGNVRANYFLGDGSQLTGTIANANYAAYAGNVTLGAQPNITSVGTLTSLTVTGDVTSANITSGNATVTGNIITGSGTGGEITGANLVSANYFTGTLTTTAQPNISSVGTLTSLNVTGNISSAANIIGAYIKGDGGFLSNIQVGAGTSIVNGTSNVAVGLNSNVSISIAGTSNIVVVSGSGVNVAGYVSATGNITGANANLGNLVTANYFTGSGNLLSNIQGANVSGAVASATTAGTVTTNAQPNITSTGTLASLNVTGNISSAANVTAQYFIGNGSQLTGLPATYANSNVAAYLPTYTGNITGNIVTLTGNITAINANLGNLVTANYFSGSGNLLSNIQGANVSGAVSSATTAGTVTTNAQPNITSTGTLVSLNVTGNITSAANVTAAYFIGDGSQLTGLPATYANSNVAAYLPTYTGNITGNIVTLTGNVSAINANLGNLVTANYFSGSGNLLSNIQGANVSGAVSSATTAGTVTTNAQPNITSVGTLTSLTVSGNTTSGNVLTDHLLYANGTAWTFGGTPQGSNTYVQFNDAGSFGGNAGLVFNKTTTTLTANNFVVSATTNLGSIANVTITGGTNGQVLSTDGSGGLSWATVSAGGGGGTASYASIYVDTFTGDGITVAFTLSAAPGSKNNTMVNYNGAYQLRGAYTISGTTITFSEAPANGSSIEVTSMTGLVSTTGAYTTRNYTGNGSTTAFSVTNGSTDSSLLVTLNGILQVPTTDYAVNGTTLTFVTAPTNGMKIQIRELASVVASEVSGLDAAVANVKISGGTSGQALITDGAGNLSFGSAGVPSGKIVALNMFLGF